MSQRGILVAVLVLAGVASAECTKDTDCKGDRVCSAGACVGSIKERRREAREQERVDKAERRKQEDADAVIEREARRGLHFGISAGVLGLEGVLDYNFGYVSLRTVAGVTPSWVIASPFFAAAFTISEHLHVHFSNVFSMAIGVGGGLRVPFESYFGPPVLAPLFVGSLSPVVLKFGDLGRHQIELRGAIGLGEATYSPDDTRLSGQLLAFLGYTFLF